MDIDVIAGQIRRRVEQVEQITSTKDMLVLERQRNLLLFLERVERTRRNVLAFKLLQLLTGEREIIGTVRTSRLVVA